MSINSHARNEKLWCLYGLILVIAAAIMLYSALAMELPFINHDVSQNFIGGRRILDGAVLYVDWIDNNPPTIYFLSALIAWVSPEPRVQLLIYHGLVLLMTAISVVIFDRGSQHLNRATRLSGVMLMIGTFACNEVLPISFGQLDHFIAIALVAHALFRSVQIFRNRMTEIVWLLLVGLCISMKPHVIILFAALEFLMRPKIDRDGVRNVLTTLVATIAPSLIFVAVFPEAAQGYFNNALSVHVDGSFAHQIRNLKYLRILDIRPVYWLSAVLFVQIYFVIVEKSQRRDSILAVVFLLVAIGVTCMPRKIWEYHLHPAVAAAGISLFWLATMNSSRKSNWLRQIVVIMLVFFCLRGFVQYVEVFLSPNKSLYAKISEITKDSKTISIFSTRVNPNFILFFNPDAKNYRRYSYDLFFASIYGEPDPVIREAKIARYAEEIN
jgi:hypothetical protein